MYIELRWPNSKIIIYIIRINIVIAWEVPAIYKLTPCPREELSTYRSTRGRAIFLETFASWGGHAYGLAKQNSIKKIYPHTGEGFWPRTGVNSGATLISWWSTLWNPESFSPLEITASVINCAEYILVWKSLSALFTSMHCNTKNKVQVNRVNCNLGPVSRKSR